MKRWIAGISTILLHLLLLLALVPVVSTQQPPAQQQKNESETAKSLRGGQGLVEAKIIAQNGYSGPSCDGGSYVGIGILVGWGATIKSVGDNTPASRAGLKEGDMILNESDLQMNWKGGEIVVLKIQRGQEQLEIAIKVEKICYDT